MATNLQHDPEVFAKIREISNADLPPQFRAKAMYALFNDDAAFTKRVAEFRAWLKANRVFYYARPRESFFVREAYNLAAAAACDKLLLEDMS